MAVAENLDFSGKIVPLVRSLFRPLYRGLLMRQVLCATVCVAVWLMLPGAVHAQEKTITNSIGMKLALIPKGEFLMGSPKSEKKRAEDELQHRVRITKPFYMGVYEVTQAEYEKVIGQNRSYFSSSGGGNEKVTGKDTSRFPVEVVNWYDAVEFCNRLSERENRKPFYVLSAIKRDKGRIKSAGVNIAGGNGYRLPSEAQWEYACRAGTTSRASASCSSSFSSCPPACGGAPPHDRSRLIPCIAPASNRVV